jgi:hypothetical protein
MWGSDQAASVEPHGFARLVRNIRAIERGLGDGVKRVYESELPTKKKLRRVGYQETVRVARIEPPIIAQLRRVVEIPADEAATSRIEPEPSTSESGELSDTSVQR